MQVKLPKAPVYELQTDNKVNIKETPYCRGYTCPRVTFGMTIASDEVTLDFYHNLIARWHNLLMLAKEPFHLRYISVVHDAKKAS
jgi:hypothetical protein